MQIQILNKKVYKPCFVNQVVTSFFHMLEKSLSNSHFEKKMLQIGQLKKALKLTSQAHCERGRESDKRQERQKGGEREAKREK